MAEVTVHEIVSVTVQVDAPFPDEHRIRPRTVWFDSYADAEQAIARALRLPFPTEYVSVIVSRERVESFDHDEDLDLDDWPSDRHIVTGPVQLEDL